MNETAKTTRPKRKFRLFPQDLSEVVQRVTKPLLGKQGASIAAIIQHWPNIVGVSYANSIAFKELRFHHTSSQLGTLVIEVESHLQPEIPYLTPMILEKCQTILGARTIEKIVALPMQASRT